LLALNEQYGIARVDRGGCDVIQFLRRGGGKIAKQMLPTHRACHAVVEDVEAIGSEHTAHLMTATVAVKE
jgi:hypothetical protein